MTTAQHGPNIFTNDEWHREINEGRFGIRARSLVAGLTKLGATMYEIDPGRANMPYHAHHGMDELILVVRGEPTLRTPEGERQLVTGDIAECPAGAAGAHQLINNADEPALIIIFSSRPEVDIVEYPDSGKLGASAGAWGTPEFQRWLLDASATMEYFEGE